MDTVPRRKRGITAVVLLLLVLAGIVACEQTNPKEKASPPTTKVSEPRDSLEYTLAVINKRGYVPLDDITVTRFRYLLVTIEAKTKNTQQQVADMSVRGMEILEERYGKRIGLLELMEAANSSMPSAERVYDYAEIMALLVTLMGR